MIFWCEKSLVKDVPGEYGEHDIKDSGILRKFWDYLEDSGGTHWEHIVGHVCTH